MEKYYSASPKSDAKPIPLLVPVVNADFIFLCISVVVQRSSDQKWSRLRFGKSDSNGYFS